MGCIAEVGRTSFPKQGNFLGKRTEVCFHFDTSDTVYGTIVRDDHENPWVTIIRLDDGRFVLATECQYAPVL
jgi:hypothetical protein